MNCLKCEVTIPESRKFCSRSCSVSFNNSKDPKRKPMGMCETCGVPCRNAYKTCRKCASIREPYPPSITIQEVKGRASYQKHAYIRYHARKILKASGVKKACRICDYSFHVEVSHIKPIHSFEPTTLISVVNSLSNLEYLCPNHHAEHEKRFPKKKDSKLCLKCNNSFVPPTKKSKFCSRGCSSRYFAIERTKIKKEAHSL